MPNLTNVAFRHIRCAFQRRVYADLQYEPDDAFTEWGTEERFGDAFAVCSIALVVVIGTAARPLNSSSLHLLLF